MADQNRLYPSDEEMNAIRKKAYDFVGIGLYRYRFDGTVIFMDRNMLRYFEIDDLYPDPEMVAGKQIGDLFIYNGPKGRLREEIRKTGVVRGLEYPFETLKGTKKWALHDSYLVRDPQTGEEAIQAIVQDITERKQAEEALQESKERERTRAEELSAILDATPGLVFITHDPLGRWMTGNRVTFELLGLPQEANVSQSAPATEKPQKFKAMKQGMEVPLEMLPVQMAARGQVVQNDELDLVFEDGHVQTIYGNAMPLRDRDGHVTGAIGAFIDITDRKQLEQELRQLNETLDQRVRERTAQLEAANKEMEAFTYSVSHDLRAPLRAVDGFSQAILEDYADKLDEEGREDLTFIRQGAQQMGKLIDDMLRLSRVGRAEMRLEPVDLSALMRAIADDLQRQDPDRQVEWQIAPDVSAWGDQPLLRILLENLLSNAWKFTGKRSVARIEVFSTTQDGETVYAVRDNGAGFDMAYVSKLFAPFQRLHTAEEFPGTGIGLAIVQRIIARHGGRVWAEGAVNQGATFYFTLPARKEES